ncbi:6-carboxytetrahydropterin synthase QueD [Desulfovibrio aminophilus]|nr:6-carboxytetrahydropterin synthase QueD [Desulfovibrio aminophilus]MCM0754816.1 6-carboxytetrahydropterin synthase QueD [Desulfovibrio aminophilus]
MEIQICLSFDAAHRLPCVPSEHKCARLHGHTFHVEFFISGEVSPKYGWVADFSDIKKVLRSHVEVLDHAYLNDIDGLINPTCENIAVWLWRRIKFEIQGLSKITVKESSTSAATYTGI